MATKPIPTPEELRQLLRYEPSTGALYWRERPPELFKPGRHGREAMAASWNKQNANKVAGSPNSWGYLECSIYTKRYLAHRIAWAIYYGEWPKEHIDHINHEVADNRICNLRVVTASGNALNRSRMRKNISGVIGVTWSKKMGKWHAQIRKGDIRLHLGFYTDIRAAEAARKRAEVDLGFYVNHGSAPC
jgi:hypothetical protein